MLNNLLVIEEESYCFEMSYRVHGLQQLFLFQGLLYFISHRRSCQSTFGVCMMKENTCICCVFAHVLHRVIVTLLLIFYGRKSLDEYTVHFIIISYRSNGPKSRVLMLWWPKTTMNVLLMNWWGDSSMISRRYCRYWFDDVVAAWSYSYFF